MKNAILFGAGSDIGSNVLLLNDPPTDGFEITDVVTRASGPTIEESLADIAARLRMTGTDPGAVIKIDALESSISVNGRRIRLHFDDVANLSSAQYDRFALGILATSRAHIRDRKVTNALERIAHVVLGVAEAVDLPAYYSPLAGADLDGLVTLQHGSPDGAGVVALGSCQCVGWTAQLRAVVECLHKADIDLCRLVSADVTIVHPDTASSIMGTVGIGARREDPRENLRPGFSQIADSLKRFAIARTRNVVSLRVLVQPPGFQICRFLVEGEVTHADVLAGCEAAANAVPRALGLTTTAMGSRAHAHLDQITTIIATPEHLHCETFPDSSGNPLTEITTQAWIHNTRGYAATVLSAGDVLLRTPTRAGLVPPAQPDYLEAAR